MIIHKDIIQGESAWFDLKRGKVSASHITDVLCNGKGRDQYMERLLSERIFKITHPSISTKGMRQGIELEPKARARYEKDFEPVELVGFVEVDDYLGCSPDGLVGDDGLIEIKCPYATTHLGYRNGKKFPTAYVKQVQSQLWITGRKWCDFVSFVDSDSPKALWKIRAYRDEKEIKVIAMGVETFIAELKELERIENKPMF